MEGIRDCGRERKGQADEAESKESVVRPYVPNLTESRQ
jgi:hypothetical protein